MGSVRHVSRDRNGADKSRWKSFAVVLISIHSSFLCDAIVMIFRIIRYYLFASRLDDREVELRETVGGATRDASCLYFWPGSLARSQADSPLGVATSAPDSHGEVVSDTR